MCHPAAICRTEPIRRPHLNNVDVFARSNTRDVRVKNSSYIYIKSYLELLLYMFGETFACNVCENALRITRGPREESWFLGIERTERKRKSDVHINR